MTSPTTAPGPRTGPPPPSRALALVLVTVPLLVAGLLWAFAWPAARMAPNDLPVGIAGPAPATEPVAAGLKADDGLFDVRTYADREAAVDAVEERDVYAVVVPSHGSAELLTASAAGPAVAELLSRAIAAQLPEGTALTVTDVVPVAEADPRGVAFGASVLPLALAGVATGSLITVLGLRGGRAVIALLGTTALVGVTGAALLHSWLGALTGSWLAVAATLMLGTLAVAATVGGCAAVLGPPGIAVGAVLVVMLGNPFSGATSAPELLPDPIGLLGQLLPPGATGSLVRSVAYFDGNGAAFPLAVLATWTALGLAALVWGSGRPQPSPSRKPATAAAH